MTDYSDDEMAPPAVASPYVSRAPTMMERVVELADFDGDLSASLDDDQLRQLAGRTMDEFDIDLADRQPWIDSAKEALKSAKRDEGRKSFPFDGASNVKMPLLTTASIQFAARAYGAIVRGEEAVHCKVLGPDPQGEKASRAQRIAAYMNWQLAHGCPEWDGLTDQLLHQLPITGAAFRKVYWNEALRRPVFELAQPGTLIVSAGAANVTVAPRVSSLCYFYPYEIARLVATSSWREPSRLPANDHNDSQAAIECVEQLRWIDFDGDGFDEPYTVTVIRETREIVRIASAFDRSDVRANRMGLITAIERQNPWQAYTFLPDVAGSGYGMGFGSLLDTLLEAINTLLNQMIDAGTLANAGGGFIGEGLKIRGGQLTIEPGQYRAVNVPSGRIADAIYTPQFQGPSQVTYQLLDLLLAAAKDMTSVSDVLSGDAPSGQAASATLALIEQSMQTFNAIYKRVFRSLKREYAHLAGLNRRYLDAEDYQAFTDAPFDPAQDFALAGLDLAPVADPSAATDAQQLGRAQFLMQFAQHPAMDAVEIIKRVLAAARITDVDKLFLKQPPQAAIIGQQMAQANVAKVKADAMGKEARAMLDAQQAQRLAFERGTMEGSVAGMGSGSPVEGLVDAPADQGVPAAIAGGGGGDAGAMGGAGMAGGAIPGGQG